MFIIAGPTAVGKSELAVEVAERCGGEIVSADAFQIYEGLDLLTAKPSAALLARVPHHLLGEIPRTQSFDVAQYLKLARERMAGIRARGRIPLIAGGAGFYLKALTHGLPVMPPADEALREELERRETGDLVQQLFELDPECHARIDQKNRRRLIRALEVCLLSGRPFSSFRDERSEEAPPSIGVIISREREELHTRIDRRTEEMFAAGVVEEVQRADTLGMTAHQTLGYTEIQAYLSGQITREKCVETIQQLTRQYAKRQLTWFRREAHWKWIDISGEKGPSALAGDLAEQAREFFKCG